MKTYMQKGIQFCEEHHYPLRNNRCWRCDKDAAVADFEAKLKGIPKPYYNELIRMDTVHRLGSDYMGMFREIAKEYGAADPVERLFIFIDIEKTDPSHLVFEVFRLDRIDEKGKPVKVKNSEELYNLIIDNKLV